MKIPKMYDGPRWAGPERSSQAIANTIMEKWAEAGHPQVKAWIVYPHVRGKCPFTGDPIIRKDAVIRSNLVNGLPPREEGGRAA